MRELRFRVVPFIDHANKQCYTIVEEWWEGGRCVEDMRRSISSESFATLLMAVQTAARKTYAIHSHSS